MIEFDVIDTPVGPCTVAMERGRVIRVHLGSYRDYDGRPTRLPQARRWVRDWFMGRDPRVPLVIDGTPFMRRVFERVRRIPAGKTLTYGEVARAAGCPGAARAVGSAMARNRVCLFIPCHRVVGSTGLGGYSGEGGLETKRRLLALESSR